MKITFFSTRSYERPFLEMANRPWGLALEFLEVPLTPVTAPLVQQSEVVSIFVNDDASGAVLETLAQSGVKLLALRSAGFNHVDLAAAERYGIQVVRVPAYSPYAVAEHTVALLQSINRKVHRAFNRVREQNFSLDGLLGFDLHEKTVGVVGTGKIGEVFCRIMGRGFGCEVLAYDPQPRRAVEALGVRYCSFEELCRRAHVISLHCPLTPTTRHLIDAKALASMQEGVIILNTSRGAVIDTRALIDSLKRGRIGAVGLDVYEEEDNLFFRNLSEEVIQDDTFVRLMSFPNVLITAHQSFFTREALTAIAETTMNSIGSFKEGNLNERYTVNSSVLR